MNYIKLFLAITILIFSLNSCKNNSDKNSEVTEVKSDQEKSESGELSDSPRHHEWVTLSHNEREFDAFVVYPESSEKAKPVIVIHENRGLNDWARLFADKLASEGYLVIAPDLISNTVKGVDRTTDFENSDAARDAIYDLDEEQVIADLDAAFEYIKNDTASTGEVAVIGFCWGGSQTFKYVTKNSDLTSAHVFYGTAPKDTSSYSQISAPVYGYYGGNDNRVNSTIEETENLMKSAGKKYEYEIYDNAGHAFMRSGHETDANDGNKNAHDKAWKRLLRLLK
ncbi:dienelactone hydrolase family protein [Christiangramia sp. SM2212]|uniref:Dienelactone hydrolase family protein n=1 Tax=Christiangramia sediminicola TaxID=3073267 RepID=A0ABU1ENQ1_9FLAO|nr:dienelactone hydrolase family protein [Christiangramia sp. SM2212]MDR5590020.1 dienelactone hydrolase family protein [Christiangramia sp. SM2212]